MWMLESVEVGRGWDFSSRLHMLVCLNIRKLIRGRRVLRPWRICFMMEARTISAMSIIWLTYRIIAERSGRVTMLHLHLISTFRCTTKHCIGQWRVDSWWNRILSQRLSQVILQILQIWSESEMKAEPNTFHLLYINTDSWTNMWENAINYGHIHVNLYKYLNQHH